MRLLVSWVRDFVDVTALREEIAERLGLRGFEVASVEPLGDDDGGHRFRGHRQPARLSERPGTRARNRGGLRSAAARCRRPVAGAKVALAAAPSANPIG